MKARHSFHGGTPPRAGGAHSAGTSIPYVHRERSRWDPKDGELFPVGTKPEETPVEVRSDSDVQIGRLSWV